MFKEQHLEGITWVGGALAIDLEGLERWIELQRAYIGDAAGHRRHHPQGQLLLRNGLWGRGLIPYPSVYPEWPLRARLASIPCCIGYIHLQPLSRLSVGTDSLSQYLIDALLACYGRLWGLLERAPAWDAAHPDRNGKWLLGTPVAVFPGDRAVGYYFCATLRQTNPMISWGNYVEEMDCNGGVGWNRRMSGRWRRVYG